MTTSPHLSPKVRMRWSRRPHAAESSRPRSENVPAQRWHDKRAEMHGSVAERSISWTEGCKLLLIPFLNGALLAYFARRELRVLSPAREPVASCARLARIRSLPGDR